LSKDNKGKKLRSDEKTLWGIKTNGPVTITSLIVVLGLVITTIAVGTPIKDWFDKAQTNIANHTGWFFILFVNVILAFAIYLFSGRFRHVRIGGKNAKPEFSTLSWLAMLFSAGMGIGLLFYGVAEPILHFASNPMVGNSETFEQSAKMAISISFVHWGIHAWALYGIVGVSMAFFTFNLKLPLTIRSVFYPIIGDKIYGPLGDIVDSIAVMATIFGLATSLGLGAQQINSGLSYLFDIPNSSFVQIAIIIIITFFATLSLALGLAKGVRFLSVWNMRLAVTLLVFMLAVGPTIFLLNGFVENTGHYITNFIKLSFWTNTYHADVNSVNTWINDWNVFFWAWWITWCPFVGIFIARISKGRTIQQFLLGVMSVPVVFTFLWFSVFGGSALFQELLGNHNITAAVKDNISTAIFYLFEQYPLSSVASFVTVILIASFFITSSDSGSYVVDILTSGGRHDSSKKQKVFWASIEGLVASTLLIGGGLVALQTAMMLTGLPFAIILIIMCASLYKALNEYIKK